MSRVHIVTDSAAHFANPHFVEQYPITVVPNTIAIGDKSYQEGVDLSVEDAMQLVLEAQMAPVVTAPGEEAFARVYRQLAESCDGIISIHPSRKLYPSWDYAKAAARQIGGHCEVVVIDSQTISVAQGMLVRVAARVSEEEDSFEEMIRKIRGTIDRIYTVFYIDEINSLLQDHILSSSHTILGAMLGLKPFLAMDDGLLKPIEKVRTRSQAIERLVEFVIEFTDIEEVVILQNKSYISDQTRMLQDRLAVEFPGRHFPYTLYGPSLTALVGTEVTGVALLESELEFLDNGF